MKIELLDNCVDPLFNISVGARVSTDSFAKDEIKNREGFVRSLIKLGHNQPVEMTFAQFRISGISRGCADQLRTYRHLSFVMQSTRYVDISDAQFIHPLSVQKLTDACFDIEKVQKRFYKELVGMGVPKGDARNYVGLGIETKCVFSCNFWTLRHIIMQRTEKHAQWEIKEVAKELARIVYAKGWGWLIDDIISQNDLAIEG